VVPALQAVFAGFFCILEISVTEAIRWMEKEHGIITNKNELSHVDGKKTLGLQKCFNRALRLEG
jgi:hypothetical protein